MNNLRFFFLVIVIFTTQKVMSQDRPMAPTAAEEKWIRAWNLTLSKNRILKSLRDDRGATDRRPYAEFEPSQYLIFDSKKKFDSGIAKHLMAAHLPEDMHLVILTHRDDSAAEIRNEYEPFVGKSRVHTIAVGDSESFWSRDALPLPIFSQISSPEPKLALVQSVYFREFTAQKDIAFRFNSEVTENPYGFEGGNFLSDARGNCFIVDNWRHREIPDSAFKNKFGCKTLTRLPHRDGIGHIDERIKILSDTQVLTDTEDYRSLFTDRGYRVTLLPRPERAMETYANALLANKTVFLPVFNDHADGEAEAIYASFGLKVVPIYVDSLPNTGSGSIHCITMTYPPAPFYEVEDRVKSLWLN